MPPPNMCPRLLPLGAGLGEGAGGPLPRKGLQLPQQRARQGEGGIRELGTGLRSMNSLNPIFPVIF